MSGGVGGRAHRHAVVVIAGAVPGVGRKQEFRNPARAVVRHGLRIGKAGNGVGIDRARQSDGVGAGHQRTIILDPVVKRIAFHERRGFQHVFHRRDAGLLLRVGRHRPGIVVRPVRAVVPFGHPDGPVGVVPDVQQEIKHLRRAPGGVGRVVGLIIMRANKIHPQRGGGGLLHERNQPGVRAGIRSGRRADAQTGRQQVAPRGNGLAHRQVRLVHLVRLVVAQQGVDAQRLPVLIETGPRLVLANGHVFQIARGILVNVPVIPPKHVQPPNSRIARNSLLARPAPQRDVNELHLLVQRGRQRANFQVAVLRDIALAEMLPVGRLREHRLVAAFQFERSDVCDPAARVVGPLAVLRRRAGEFRPGESSQRSEARRLRNHDGAVLAVLHYAHIAVGHGHRSVHFHLAEIHGRRHRRFDARQKQPGVAGIQIDGAA